MRQDGWVLVDIIVYDGLGEIDALGPLEVLRSVGRADADLTARLATRSPQQLITGAYGLRFLPDTVYEPGWADVVLLTSGGWAARAEAGAWGEVQRGDWLPLLADAARTGRVHRHDAARPRGRHRQPSGRRPPQRLGGPCGQRRHPRQGARGRRGHLLTSGGVTSGIDLALWLVEREFGRELADKMGRPH